MTDALKPFVTKIAEIAGLSFDVEVKVREEPSLQRERARLLFHRELCLDPSRFGLPNDLERKGLGPPRLMPDYSIVDILGEYFPEGGEVIIYDTACQLAAEALKADPELVKRVVLVHQAAHAVTHLGKDKDGQIWQHFAHADPEDKEQFAWVYSSFYFEETRDTQGDKIFRGLWLHHPTLCRERLLYYEFFERVTRNELNRMLREVRRQEPPEMIVEWCKIEDYFFAGSFNADIKVLSDGQVFIGKYPMRPQPAGKAPQETIKDLRKAVEESGIMNIPSQDFEPHDIPDELLEVTLRIKLGSQTRYWRTQREWGENGEYQDTFSRIEQLIQKAAKEAGCQIP